MTLSQLVGLYLVIGVGCAAVILWRADEARLAALPSAAAALVVWPLWVPFALSSPGGSPSTMLQPSGTQPTATRGAGEGRGGLEAAGARFDAWVHPSAERIVASLEGIRHNDHDVVMTADDIDVIERAVARATQRLFEMDRQLARLTPDAQRLGARLSALAQSGAEPRGLETARRHAATLERLTQLRHREHAVLDELADAIDLMNAQLALARFGESTSLDELKSELWLRIDAMDETTAIVPL